MKLMYIIIALSILLITLAAKAQKVFLKAQTSGWYPLFLKPVVDAVLADKNSIKVLDIGTGPGKLLELLIKQNENLQLTGIDIDTSMINEARKRLMNKNVSFLYEKVNKKLEFADNEFNVVTFCSVLFLLDDSTKTFLLNEALRVLKPDGKIVVLSPSGKKAIISSFTEVWRYPFTSTNWTFIVWKTFTTRGGNEWRKNNWLQQYARKNKQSYSTELVFNNNAILETINQK